MRVVSPSQAMAVAGLVAHVAWFKVPPVSGNSSAGDKKSL
jgi:hypothetical protein